jgi:hypothetical protein
MRDFVSNCVATLGDTLPLGDCDDFRSAVQKTRNLRVALRPRIVEQYAPELFYFFDSQT